METWPTTREELAAVQLELGGAPPPSVAVAPGVATGAVFACFAGVEAWAAAAVGEATAVVRGAAGAPYEPGFLALRAGPLLEAAVLALPERPGVLLVNATGRDHARRAGLALHLGAVLGLPTVGVTHRPLAARGAAPGDRRGDRAPLLLDGETVGFWLRTRREARPLAVHAGWGLGPEAAAEIVLAATGEARTPEPLRLARWAAREARACDLAGS